MQVQVTFRHMKTDTDLQTAAHEAAVGFEKYYDNITSCNIVFNNDAEKEVEMTVHVNGTTLVVKDYTIDFHKSLYEATDKMVRQIVKWKEKNHS